MPRTPRKLVYPFYCSLTLHLVRSLCLASHQNVGQFMDWRCTAFVYLLRIWRFTFWVHSCNKFPIQWANTRTHTSDAVTVPITNWYELFSSYFIIRMRCISTHGRNARPSPSSSALASIRFWVLCAPGDYTSKCSWSSWQWWKRDCEQGSGGRERQSIAFIVDNPSRWHAHWNRTDGWQKRIEAKSGVCFLLSHLSSASWVTLIHYNCKSFIATVSFAATHRASPYVVRAERTILISSRILVLISPRSHSVLRVCAPRMCECAEVAIFNLIVCINTVNALNVRKSQRSSFSNQSAYNQIENVMFNRGGKKHIWREKKKCMRQQLNFQRILSLSFSLSWSYDCHNIASGISSIHC